MRKPLIVLGAAYLLLGCGSDSAPGGGTSGPYGYGPYAASPYAYHDWLYLHYYWYDDDFWEWVDDHPGCCYDRDDIKQGLQTWYQGLDPSQQQAVRDHVQGWMDENGVVPAEGQSPRDLVLQTASDRWAALTPDERKQWLDQRGARIEQRRAAGSASRPTLEQRAAMRERAAGLTPEQRSACARAAGAAASTAAAVRDPRSAVIRFRAGPACPRARASGPGDSAVAPDVARGAPRVAQKR